ncbi:MAG: BspA family leucine-rich repeat surface protein [Bradymonadales bacterium]
MNIDKVRSLEGIEGAEEFNVPLQFLCTNTCVVTNTSYMFKNASAFNSYLYIDTTNVSNMRHMFYNARKFNRDISNWNYQKAASNMKYFLYGATAFSKENYCKLKAISVLKYVDLGLTPPFSCK